MFCFSYCVIYQNYTNSYRADMNTLVKLFFSFIGPSKGTPFPVYFIRPFFGDGLLLTPLGSRLSPKLKTKLPPKNPIDCLPPSYIARRELFRPVANIPARTAPTTSSTPAKNNNHAPYRYTYSYPSLPPPHSLYSRTISSHFSYISRSSQTATRAAHN